MVELRNETLHNVAKIALKAGEIIMQHYNAEQPSVPEKKTDGTPVTQADLDADQCIRSGILENFPDAIIRSEETHSEQIDVQWPEEFWLVDPLDGTKEYLRRTGEFTVNIALIRKQRPVLGVVYCPALQELYIAQEFSGAFYSKNRADFVKISSRVFAEKSPVFLGSRSHGFERSATKLQLRWPGVELVPMGSSLKICRIASGAADFYLRRGPTSEWDTAAGQIVLECAGGVLLNVETGTPLIYGKKDPLNSGFYAAGDAQYWQKNIGLLNG